MLNAAAKLLSLLLPDHGRRTGAQCKEDCIAKISSARIHVLKKLKGMGLVQSSALPGRALITDVQVLLSHMSITVQITKVLSSCKVNVLCSFRQ